MSVNDAANNWRALEHADGSEWSEAMRTPESGAMARECANDLDRIAQNAWHPVSKPPTEEDGDGMGYILIWTEKGLDMVKWDEEILEVPKPYITEAMYWARIRDVVLFPEKPF